MNFSHMNMLQYRQLGKGILNYGAELMKECGINYMNGTTATILKAERKFRMCGKNTLKKI
jgi:2-iminoacetate synthase ThiH